MATFEDLTTEELTKKSEQFSQASSLAAAHGVELPDTAKDEHAAIAQELERRAARTA